MKNHQTPSQGETAAPLNLNKFAASPSDETELAADGGSQTLFIRKTAAEAAPAAQEVSTHQEAEFGLPHQDMLGLITYCYVRGVFSSKEIAERLQREPELRKSFGKKLPDEADIKSFRRRHAEEIEALLESVYRQFPDDDASVPSGPGAADTAVVHRKAVERLHDASWEDAVRGHLH